MTGWLELAWLSALADQFSGRAPVSAEDRRMAGGNVTAITDPGTDAGPVTTRYDPTLTR